MSAPAGGGIPRYRPTRLPPLFSQGFRPFFLVAAIWSALAVALWILFIAGRLDLPTHFDPPAWHAHEMLFGFALPAMAGFLLTTIPNWTGRMPLQGVPLVCLALAWLAGRLAIAGSAIIGGAVAAILDLAFPVLLLLALGREIVAGRNWRNLPMLGGLGLLIAANAQMHLYAGGVSDDRRLGWALAIAVLAAMIGLVGGRIIPSFTRNYLARRGGAALPAPFGAIDRAALTLVPLALLAWITEIDALTAGILLLAAGIALAARLARWRAAATLSDALLWPLHLGYAWLALGLSLLGLGELWPDWPPAAGLHAVTAGAIGSMILAVMARATLAHTGRRATALPGTALLQLLVSLSALLRIAAAFASDWYLPLLTVAGLAWIAAFALFALVYGRLLLLPAHRGR